LSGTDANFIHGQQIDELRLPMYTFHFYFAIPNQAIGMQKEKQESGLLLPCLLDSRQPFLYTMAIIETVLGDLAKNR
jgi:hypothetical protein